MARRLQNSRKPLRAQRNSRNFAQQQWRHRVAAYLRAFLVWPATRLRSAVALRRALRGLTPCIQHALHCEPEAISAPHERAKKSKNPVQFTRPPPYQVRVPTSANVLVIIVSHQRAPQVTMTVW